MLETAEKLTVTAVAGDREALRRLLRRHDGHLRRVLAGGIRPTHRSAFDVDDVLQVTYLEAFLQIGQFSRNRSASFRAWLTKIAENNLRDAVRELGREKRPPRNKQLMLSNVYDSSVALFGVLAGSASTPTKHLAAKDAVSLLEEALRRLPPDYETVVRLNDLEGLPACEVAEAMDRSVGSVYMLKARAHERLAVLLGSRSKF